MHRWLRVESHLLGSSPCYMNLVIHCFLISLGFPICQKRNNIYLPGVCIQARMKSFPYWALSCSKCLGNVSYYCLSFQKKKLAEGVPFKLISSQDLANCGPWAQTKPAPLFCTPHELIRIIFISKVFKKAVSCLGSWSGPHSFLHECIDVKIHQAVH